MFRKIVVCATLLGMVVFALASSGGGKKKSASSSSTLGIVPIRANGTLDHKTRPGYSGSHLFRTVTNGKTTVYRSLITYQKGNTTYIVPSVYRLNNKAAKLTFKSSAQPKSNLNVLDLKLRLCR